MKLIENGADSERMYIAFLVIRTGELLLENRALVGVEIVFDGAIDGAGVYLDLLYLKLRFSAWAVVLVLFLIFILLFWKL